MLKINLLSPSTVKPAMSKKSAERPIEIGISRSSVAAWQGSSLGGLHDPRMLTIVKPESPPIIGQKTPTKIWMDVADFIIETYPQIGQEKLEKALDAFFALGDAANYYRGLSRCGLLAHWGCEINTILAGLFVDFDIERVEEKVQNRDIDAEVVTLLKSKRFLDLFRFRGGKNEEKNDFMNMLILLENNPQVHLLKAADEYRLLWDETEAAKAKKQAIHSRDITAVLLKLLGKEQAGNDIQKKAFYLIEPVEPHEIKERERIERLIEEERLPQDQLAAIYHEVHEALNKISRLKDKFSITDFPKTRFRIERKRQDMKKGEKLHDLNRFRVTIEGTKEDCYTAKTEIQKVMRAAGWTYIKKKSEQADHIKNKKDNGYQSLHLFFRKRREKGKVYLLEVQVRTKEMHLVAEFGPAAHWRIHERRIKHDSFDALLNALQNSGVVYALDPSGGIHKLVPAPRPGNNKPITALDFAYAKMVDRGDHCPKIVIRDRVDRETGIILKPDEKIPRSEVVENGDEIYIPPGERELNPAEIDEALKNHVSTLRAINGLRLLKEAGIDKRARQDRRDDLSIIGRDHLRAELEDLREKLRTNAERELRRKYQKKFGPRIHFSLDEAIRKVGLEDKEELKEVFGRPERNLALLDRLRQIIRRSYCAVYCKDHINEDGTGTAELRILIRNKEAVQIKLMQILKDNGVTLIEGKRRKKMSRSRRRRKAFRPVIINVSFKNQEDLRKALAELDNLYERING